MNFSRVPSNRSTAAAIGEGSRHPGADVLRIVLGEHPHVVDEVGEEGGHDAPVASGPKIPAGSGHLTRTRTRAGRAERRAAARTEARIRSGTGPAERTAHVRAGTSGDGEERRASRGGGPDAHPGGYCLCDRGQRVGCRAGLSLGDGRDPDVPPWRTVTSSGTPPKYSRPCPAANRSPPPRAEDLGQLAAVRAGEGGHVLDDAEDRHVRALEHREGLGDVAEADLLRRRDEHGPRDRHGLGRVSWASDVPGGRSMTR